MSLQGVSVLKVLPSGDFLIGTGNGTVAALRGKTYKCFKSATVEGSITSIAVRGSGHQFLVGTSVSQIYLFQFNDFTYELLRSCHADLITDICFPRYLLLLCIIFWDQIFSNIKFHPSLLFNIPLYYSSL